MGWTYNTLEGTASEGPRITAIALTVTILALIALLLRLYVRTLIVKAVGADDWTIIVSWIGICGYTVSTIVQTKWGLGLVRLQDMPDENLYNFGLMQYIGAPFYVIGIWGFKTSLLFSYVRFVPGLYRAVPLTVAGVVTMAHIAFTCVFLFMCTPVEKIWNPVLKGHCVEAVPFYLSFSSLTIVFDVVTLVLPFPILLKLNMKLRKKLVLLSLFALGIFVTVIQVIRIQTIRSLENYLDSARAIKWSIVENAVGIIIACVPTLAPLIKYFSEKTRNGTGSRSSGKSGGDDDGYVRGNNNGGGGAHNESSSSSSPPHPLQSWKASRSGMRPLGSSTAVNKRSEIHGIVEGSDESTEDILGSQRPDFRGGGVGGAGTPRQNTPSAMGY